MNPVLKRVITALSVASFVVCSLLFLPLSVIKPALIVLILLVQLELSQLVAKKYEIMTFASLLAGLILLVAVGYWPNSFAYVLPPLVFLISMSALFSDSSKPMESLGATLLSFVYIPAMLSFFLLLPIEHGMKYLLYIVAIVKVSDMGGYAFGKAFGKHKMCPTISPKKSWEGLAGSVFASCLISCAFIPLTYFSIGKALAFGVTAALVGTLGDLVESRIKREAEVKDSATFMPAGMGGFLDMFDSLVFAPAILYPFI